MLRGGPAQPLDASHSDVLVQTKLVGRNLHIFALAPPLLDGRALEGVPIPDSLKAYDFIGDPEVNSRDVSGEIARMPLDWNLDGDWSRLGIPSQAPLDGEGVYVTDFGVLSSRELSFPDEDGTYVYSFTHGHDAGLSATFQVTYTRSEDTATLVYNGPDGSEVLHEGEPLFGTFIGVAMSLAFGPVGAMSEAEKERLSLGTWTVFENLNGVEGVTGQYDVRMLSLRNLRVEPESFNPAEGEATLRGDVVALPFSTALTPSGWVPAGNVDWRLQVGTVRTFEGSFSPSTPDPEGVVGSFEQAWDGTDGLEEPVLNGEYEVTGRALAQVSLGHTVTEAKTALVTVGSQIVRIENLTASPVSFNPEQGETTTLSFDILAEGLEAPELSWRVRVLQDGAVFHQFPVGSIAGVAEHHVELAPWDGRDATGAVIEGEFDWEVQATACDGVSARSVSPDTHRALFQVGSGECSVIIRLMRAAAGLYRVEFVQDGKKVTEVEPSYLFSVEGERLDPAPQQGSIPGEDGGKLDGEASVVTVRVTRGPGLLLDPVDLELKVTGLEGTGGHLEAFERPAGTFLPAEGASALLRVRLQEAPGSLTKLFDGVVPGQTVTADYTAPFAAGVYRFELRRVDTGQVVAFENLRVRVPELVHLSNSFSAEELGDFGTFRDGIVALFGATEAHRVNHYGTPAMNAALAAVCRDYARRMRNQTTFPSVPRLSGRPNEYDPRIFVNDMSLIDGGLFELGHLIGSFLPPLSGTEGHFEHRLGTNADLITEPIDRGVNVDVRTPERDVKLEEVLHDHGFEIYNEIERSPEGPHYHVRLRGGN